MSSRRENVSDSTGLPNVRASHRSSRPGSRSDCHNAAVNPVSPRMIVPPQALPFGNDHFLLPDGIALPHSSDPGSLSDSHTGHPHPPAKQGCHPRAVLSSVDPDGRESFSGGTVAAQAPQAGIPSDDDGDGALGDRVPKESLLPQGITTPPPETRVQGRARRTKKDRKRSAAGRASHVAQPKPAPHRPLATLNTAGCNTTADSATGSTVPPKTRAAEDVSPSQPTKRRKSDRLQNLADNVTIDARGGRKPGFKYVVYKGKLLEAKRADELELPFCTGCPLAFPNGQEPARRLHERLPHGGFPRFSCSCRCVFETKEEFDEHSDSCEVAQGRAPVYLLVEYGLPGVPLGAPHDCDDE